MQPDTAKVVELGEDDWIEPLAREAYYGVAGDFVRAVEPHTEADAVALLTNFLIGSGILFGQQAWCIADGRKHYPAEFLVTVGETGASRKGTASARVLAIMERAEENFCNQHVLSGLSSGEGLIKGMQNQTGVDSTRRFLGFLPEFGSLLDVMRREGNTMSAILRQAWDGDPLRVLTKREPLDVSNFVLALICHITPTELLTALSAVDRANGFANRFLFALVRRSKFLPEGGGTANTNQIVSRLHSAVMAAKGRGLIARDETARECWSVLYPELTSGREGLKGALCSRAEAHVLRLSLIYALLDSADSVRLEHLRAAHEVWRYCERSIVHIFAGQSGDLDADRILRALSSGSKTLSELHRAFGNNRTAEWLTAKLASMERKKQIRSTIADRNRKSVKAWETA